MTIPNDTPATALASLMLSMNTFLILRQSRVLTYDQANEVLEQALLNFETQQGKAQPAMQAVIQEARDILDHLRQLIGKDPY